MEERFEAGRALRAKREVIIKEHFGPLEVAPDRNMVQQLRIVW